MEDHREKVKIFLITKLEECEKSIIQNKKKYKIIKITYFIMMTTAIIGSTIVSVGSALVVNPLIFCIISATTAIITAIGFKFNIENVKIELNKKIQHLHNIKDKLDYIISCNGDLTEIECNKILNDFIIL
jgi:hypothetical protein